jgi:hypothetical protein
MNRQLLLLLFLFICATSFSQNLVKGSITDSAKVPIPFCAMTLLNAKDSSQVKGNISNDNGDFIFENITSGSYFIKFSSVGFKEGTSSIFKIDSLSHLELGPQILRLEGINLQEVSVSAIKRAVEFKGGNIIVNVDGSPIAIGNNLYDLLSRLPGVTIVDDVISLQGKANVRILIDDRMQQFSGIQLINLLKSLSASSIDKIEILKNPPSKYDAAGSGLINIKTKKAKIVGSSGSVFLSYSQGFYANKDGGFSLNYKGKKVVLFSNFNSGNDEFRYTSVYNKKVSFNGLTTDFHQVTYERNTTNSIFMDVGADWYLNKRNTVGIKVEASHGINTPLRHGNNFLSNSDLGYNRLQFSSSRPNTWNFINYNLNYEHRFDSLGTLIRFSSDFSDNYDLNDAIFENHFIDSSNSEILDPKIFKTKNDLHFTILSSKLDFEKQLTKSLKLEAGLKGNQQKMLSDYIFTRLNAITGNYDIDTNYSNIFSYNEQILAGYAYLQKQYKKVNFQLGARGENTLIKTESISRSIGFNRQYFNIFPNLSMDYNPTEKNSFQVSYNRRIERPNFMAFNPYKYYVNLFVSFQGNPYLTPQYFNAFDFTHGYKHKVYNSISYSQVEHIFYSYPVQNDSTKETMGRQGNLSNCYMFSHNLFVQMDIAKWWSMSCNTTVSYLTFSGNIDGNEYSGTSFQYYVFLNSQFVLPRNFRIELNGQYIAPGNVIIYNNSNRWGLNIAIKKSFFKNKLNLVVGGNDVFYTMKVLNTVSYLNMQSNLINTNDTQRYKISLNYNFGKIRVEKRNTKSNEEEKRRLNH